MAAASHSTCHPVLLADPLLDLPNSLRRFLVDLESLTQLFGASEVSGRFHVSPKTARVWLKGWSEAGFIEPGTPGAQRVHKFRLTSAWLGRLDAEVDRSQ